MEIQKNNDQTPSFPQRPESHISKGSNPKRKEDQELLNRQIEALREQNHHLSQEILSLRNSYSWRISQPARTLLVWLEYRWNRFYKLLAVSGSTFTSDIQLGWRDAQLYKKRNRRAPSISSAPDNPNFRSGVPYDAIYVVGCREGESKRYRVFNMMSELQRFGWNVLATHANKIDLLIKEKVSARRIIFFRQAFNTSVSKFLAYAQRIEAFTYFDVDDLIFEPASITWVRAI